MMWDEKFGADHFFYGTEPGDVLCLADGEGRNGVYLATQGHRVTSVDSSAAGLAKTQRLAAERGVSVTTVPADLADFIIEPGAWDVIVSIFCHLPPPLRRSVHAACGAGLKPGGRFVLEAYTPDQVGRGTGGPPTADLMMTLADVSAELEGLDIVHGVETVRPIHEGRGHTGDGAVVQIIAVKREAAAPHG